MALASIRTAVKALLEAVTNVGKVNDLDPWNYRPEDFADTFVDLSRNEIRGWAIGIREGRGRSWMGIYERAYEVRLLGYYGRQEDTRSRETADNLLEAVLTKFFGTAANRRLPYSGTPSVQWTEEPQTTVEDYMIRTGTGEVPGHRITITFNAVTETATV